MQFSTADFWYDSWVFYYQGLPRESVIELVCIYTPYLSHILYIKVFENSYFSGAFSLIYHMFNNFQIIFEKLPKISLLRPILKFSRPPKKYPNHLLDLSTEKLWEKMIELWPVCVIYSETCYWVQSPMKIRRKKVNNKLFSKFGSQLKKRMNILELRKYYKFCQ